MFTDKEKRRIVQGGKGKDRATLIKSLIYKRVEEAFEWSTIKDLIGIGLEQCFQTAWASADFFPEEGKIFLGGKNILFALKMPKNTLFSSKKSRITYYLGQPGGCKCPIQPSPADAHAQLVGQGDLFVVHQAFIILFKKTEFLDTNDIEILQKVTLIATKASRNNKMS